AAGFFNGATDEARVWNVARTQAQIQGSMNAEITGPTSGLGARWAHNADAGTTLGSSAGSALDGGIAGNDWSWAAGSTFDAAPPSAPAAPTGLAALAIIQGQINLSWTDVATNESSYEVERSTTGSGGPFNPLVTLPADATTYVDPGVTADAQYCYRVRAANGTGHSAYAGPACATALGAANKGLGNEFDAYVDFGDAPSLRLSQWTIELWVRREGDGSPTTTGTGGLADVAPLVTKGRDEGDASNVDINYFFGIRRSNSVL